MIVKTPFLINRDLIKGNVRSMMDHRAESTRVVAVTSGKGGVGKTSVVINLAVALAKTGKKCLVLDADVGLGNIDQFLNLSAGFNIGHVISGEKALEDVIVNGPSGVKILPAASGVQGLTNLSASERIALSSHLEDLNMDIDIMIMDTGAGISDNVLFFNLAAQDIIVVATPDPSSISDALVLMGVMLKKYGQRRYRLLANAVRNRKEGLDVFKNISASAERLLNISIDYMGAVLRDENVRKASMLHKTVVEAYPDSKASACFHDMATEVSSMPVARELKGGLQFLWRRMLSAGAQARE